jgi:Domain of unknown function (DUF4194)
MATAVPNPLSLALIALMKGVIEREAEPAIWQTVLELQARIRDYVAVLGLELVVDESEGYAYLRQRPAQEGEADLPRLVPRRQLGYQVSLLLALLRKKLVEFDAASGDTRLILSRDEIAEMMRLFLSDSANQVRLLERIDANINRVVEMGFLRKLRGTSDRFEVRRILKAFVDGQWLAELDGRLRMYRAHAESERIEAASNEPN